VDRSELGLCESRFGEPPGLIWVDLFDGSDRDAALLRSDAVLGDPDALAACTEPDAEAGESIIELDMIALSRGEGKAGDIGAGKAYE
jgi:hypothetical protein